MPRPARRSARRRERGRAATPRRRWRPEPGSGTTAPPAPTPSPWGVAGSVVRTRSTRPPAWARCYAADLGRSSGDRSRLAYSRRSTSGGAAGLGGAHGVEGIDDPRHGRPDGPALGEGRGIRPLILV